MELGAALLRYLLISPINNLFSPEFVLHSRKRPTVHEAIKMEQIHVAAAITLQHGSVNNASKLKATLQLVSYFVSSGTFKKNTQARITWVGARRSMSCTYK